MHSLPQDILLHLLCACDIASVLAMGQVSAPGNGKVANERPCTDFEILQRAQSGQTSLGLLVSTLTKRGLRYPEPEEDLHNLSQSALVALTRSAVRATRRWLDPDPESTPKLRREVFAPCEIFTRSNFFTGRGAALSGGRFVVVSRISGLRVLEAKDGRVVGRHEARDGAHVLQWEATVDVEGDVFVTLLTEHRGQLRRSGLEVVRFATDASEELPAQRLFEFYLENSHNEYWIPQAQTNGEFSAVAIPTNSQWNMLVVDWKKNRYIIQFSLRVPKKLILATRGLKSVDVAAYDMSSLVELWRQLPPAIRNLDELARTSITSLSPSFYTDIPCAFSPTQSWSPAPNMWLTVYEDPLA
ncbi:hypothetical protein MKEN_00855100 [Mycena kentingensis (nom. inval.)]|nr:hypothetical protein MKEN_00855100 [Mycena kentingensis (nom. inval.)]